MRYLCSSTIWSRIPGRLIGSQTVRQVDQTVRFALASRWSSTGATHSNVPPDPAPFVVDPTTLQRPATFTRPQIVTTDDGREMIAFDMRPHPKLKPRIVAGRLAKMRTYIGQEKNIRHSPWRLNLVCQFAAKQPLEEAMKQLQFSKKLKAPLVAKVLKRTSNLADIRDGLQMSQLEVAECFATKGVHLKRAKPRSRGQAGIMHHKHSHFRVVLREIDFPLKIYQAKTLGEKRRWYLLQQKAEKDYARVKAERDEIKRLERETASNQA